MPKKYSIQTQAAPPRFYPVGKYATVEFRENCAGSCKACVKKNCVYDIFKAGYLHMSRMDEPEYLYTCNSCFRCIQECTRGIFSRVINPEYREIGDDYYARDIIHRTWYQAHTGSIPVSGAGYRGPFAGKGFDSMWTDMSEIVRPTRDGIHGREYINTCIELSRRPDRLAFNEDGSLAVRVRPILEIPLPVLFEKPDFGVLSQNVLLSMIRAAEAIGTRMFLAAGEITRELIPHVPALVPVVKTDTWPSFTDVIQQAGMVEVEYGSGIESAVRSLRAMSEDLVISVSLPLKAGFDWAGTGVELARTDMDTLHVRAACNGRECGSDRPRFIKDMLRDVHLALVRAGIRRQVNILASGGISMAEHVNKAIICGADGVVIDRPLIIAMECRICGQCRQNRPCPVQLQDIDPEYGSRRIINLMGAWRNQMLEMLGAMGLREIRRLRGEVGRSMWFEDLERESFGPIFGERRIALDEG